MLADYMTKLLVGSKFKLFRDLIMILHGKHHWIKQHQECCAGEEITSERVKGSKRDGMYPVNGSSHKDRSGRKVTK
jgi:hypothetical protein